MPYTYFHERIPELGMSETRTVLLQGHPTLPDDEYAFLELYCDNPDCDCRRVVLRVICKQSVRTILATISYGWEGEEFYRKKLGEWDPTEEYSGAMLDPCNEQTGHADALLDLFLDVVLTDVYEERLKKHYRMFKAVFQKNQSRSKSAPPKRFRR